jgi:Uncharacterized alpha/beta hydrolase domain (DUF2235)
LCDWRRYGCNPLLRRIVGHRRALGWTHVALSKLFLSTYDEHFVHDIPFARHAMAIDEYRRDFVRVPCGGSGTVSGGDIEGVTRFRQTWFAGNHADVGGSYPENESRLSDIALKWMVDFIATEIPDATARNGIAPITSKCSLPPAQEAREDP